jgi:hypothetical protein
MAQKRTFDITIREPLNSPEPLHICFGRYVLPPVGSTPSRVAVRVFANYSSLGKTYREISFDKLAFLSDTKTSDKTRAITTAPDEFWVSHRWFRELVECFRRVPSDIAVDITRSIGYDNAEVGIDTYGNHFYYPIRFIRSDIHDFIHTTVLDITQPLAPIFDDEKIFPSNRAATAVPESSYSVVVGGGDGAGGRGRGPWGSVAVGGEKVPGPTVSLDVHHRPGVRFGDEEGVSTERVVVDVDIMYGVTFSAGTSSSSDAPKNNAW